jgi:hypothetical protein
MPRRGEDAMRDERYGFDDTRYVIADAIGKFVPQSLARRALAVTVETDKDRYRLGEPVRLTVTIRNKLPVPMSVATPGRRLWGWTVDGELEASDESRYEGDSAGTLVFRASEEKVLRHEWSGRFKRVGDRTTWETPDRGTHEIGAFVAVEPPRPEDSVLIRIG